MTEDQEAQGATLEPEPGQSQPQAGQHGAVVRCAKRQWTDDAGDVA